MSKAFWRGRAINIIEDAELTRAHDMTRSRLQDVIASPVFIRGDVIDRATQDLLVVESEVARRGMTLGVPVMGPVTPFKRPQPKAGGEYKMVNKGNDRGEIYIYGIIGVDWFGEGVTAKQFATDLKGLGNVKTIDLRINSDGGVVTDARAMHTLLVEHPADVITHIDGIAASAASFLAMAGKEIRIAEGGFMMIHNARMRAYGEADDMRHAATVLDTVNETIRSTYQKRSGADAADIKKWMDAETWWNGKEAVEHGFADKIVEDMKVAACLHDPSRFKNLPAALRPNRAAALAALDKMKTPLR